MYCGFDFGDVDFSHFHHRFEGTFCFSAAVLQSISQAAQALKEKRDNLNNELETALEEVRAKYNAKRVDLENGREDDLAKIDG